MKRKSHLKRQKGPLEQLLTVILLAILVVLKSIGDAIFFIVQVPFLLLLLTCKNYLFLLKTFRNILVKLFTTIGNIRLPKAHQKRNGVVYSGSFVQKISLDLKRKVRKMRAKIILSIPSWCNPTTLARTLAMVLLRLKYFILGGATVVVLIGVVQMVIFINDLPNLQILPTRDVATTTKLLDRNGKLLYEIYSDYNRTNVTLKEVPKALIDATVSTEDKEFYLHHGYSLRGIVRALVRNLQFNSLEGGSTITQQLIRSAFLTPEKTIRRKIKEIILAVWAEQIYTKDEILEMYFNQVPYGGTAWGVEAAAQTYFGKSVKELTLSQAAFLAGLPASPSQFSPFGLNPNLYKTRQHEVLTSMLTEGYISREQYDQALKDELALKTPRIAIAAPHFVMYVKDYLEKIYGPRLVAHGGLQVTTTLDLDLYNKTQQILTQEMETLRSLSVGNGAALVTDSKTGEILSMIGSADYFDYDREGNVNVTTALRPPGSSIKVVTYATALQEGFTDSSVIRDSPVSYQLENGTSYRPVNYDGRYHGTVTLRRALGSSYNVPAVKVLADVGLLKMIEQGKKMGITTWNDTSRFGLSLTLGGGEVTMLDMTKVYGTLANHGERNDLTPILRITDYRGNTIPLPRVAHHIRAVPEYVAYILSDILSDNEARTPAFGPDSKLVIPGKTVAVKTGTSDNKRDNWTIGYTPDFVVTVWVGNNDNSPMHPTLTSGVTGAAPIWHEIMSEILKDKPDKPFPIPENAS